VISFHTANRLVISRRDSDAVSRCRRSRKCGVMPLNAQRNGCACRGEANLFIPRAGQGRSAASRRTRQPTSGRSTKTPWACGTPGKTGCRHCTGRLHRRPRLSERAGGRQDLLLGRTPPQRVFALYDGHRLNGMRTADRRGGSLSHAECLTLPASIGSLIAPQRLRWVLRGLLGADRTSRSPRPGVAAATHRRPAWCVRGDWTDPSGCRPRQMQSRTWVWPVRRRCVAARPGRAHARRSAG
jgi:hypothetical protein